MPTVILRSPLGRAGVIAVGLLCLYPVGVIWLADGYGHGLRALAIACAATVVCWLLWWRPEMRLTQEAVVVRNALRSYRVGWGAIVGVRARWRLELEVADAGSGGPRRVAVDACQRSGALEAMRPGRGGVPEEYTTPISGSPDAVRVYRTRMTSDDASHLLELYRVSRAGAVAAADRQRRRARRMGRAPLTDEGGEGARAGSDAADWSGGWDVAPVAAGALAAAGIAATALLL